MRNFCCISEEYLVQCFYHIGKEDIAMTKEEIYELIEEIYEEYE